MPQYCGSGPPTVFSRLSMGSLAGDAENGRWPTKSDTLSDGF